MAENSSRIKISGGDLVTLKEEFLGEYQDPDTLYEVKVSYDDMERCLIKPISADIGSISELVSWDMITLKMDHDRWSELKKLKNS